MAGSDQAGGQKVDAVELVDKVIKLIENDTCIFSADGLDGIGGSDAIFTVAELIALIGREKMVELCKAVFAVQSR